MVIEKNEIKRGSICTDDNERLFIVINKEPIGLSWNGEWTGSDAWVGAVLLDGTYTLCVKPKLIANTFLEYVTNCATDIGIKAAKVEVAELRKKLS